MNEKIFNTLLYDNAHIPFLSTSIWGNNLIYIDTSI